MVIHFMAFRGELPYIAKGDTLQSLNELRQEVQNFAGYLPFSDDSELIRADMFETTEDPIYLMNYMNFYASSFLDLLVSVRPVKKSS